MICHHKHVFNFWLNKIKYELRFIKIQHSLVMWHSSYIFMTQQPESSWLSESSFSLQRCGQRLSASSRLCHHICILNLNFTWYLNIYSRSVDAAEDKLFTLYWWLPMSLSQSLCVLSTLWTTCHGYQLGYIGHCWMMKTRRNTITFLVFFQEKCRAIKFNLVVETLFSFCLFDFFCSRQTNNLNMKQQPQKQQSWDIFWLNLEKSKDFD